MARPTIRCGIALIDDLLKRYNRIAVVGGPVTGKSIITEAVTDRPVIHSDDLHDSSWSGKSEDLKKEAEKHDRFVIAGIAADRAVRKGLEVDVLVHCTRPRRAYKTGQRVLKDQIDRRVRELEATGIPRVEFTAPGSKELSVVRKPRKG